MSCSPWQLDGIKKKKKTQHISTHTSKIREPLPRTMTAAVPGRLKVYENTTHMRTTYHKALKHIKTHYVQVRGIVKAGLKSVVLINNAAWCNLRASVLGRFS